jgi:hypothetical protein
MLFMQISAKLARSASFPRPHLRQGNRDERDGLHAWVFCSFKLNMLVFVLVVLAARDEHDGFHTSDFAASC